MVVRVLDRAQRLSIIERMLFRHAGGLRAVEIADACGVDRRTAYRDLAVLERSGVPIAQQDGRFFINRDYYSATVRLNVNEALALYTAARMLSRQAHHQNPHLVAALSKLSATLPESMAAHISFIADVLRAAPVDRSFVQVLETITRAWVERRIVHLWTADTRGSEVRSRDFATYFIEPTLEGGLYVVGHDDLTGRVRSFKIDAIRRARLLETPYEIPGSFDRRGFMESAWGVMTEGQGSTRVTLAFPSDLVGLVKERIWHPSQRIEAMEDRRVTLTIQVGDWHDVLPWIRSWGPQVEVLEPVAMREALGMEAARALTVYMAARSR